MQFNITLMSVLDDEQGLTVVLGDACIGKLAQLFDQLLFEPWCRRKLRRVIFAEGQHAGGVVMLEAERVTQRGHLPWITFNQLRRGIALMPGARGLVLVQRIEKIAHRRGRALGMYRKTVHHRATLPTSSRISSRICVKRS
ncbi:hypothetical protein D3C84_509950 [compost metagenome]